MQDAVASVAFGQGLVMSFTGVGFVGIHLFPGICQQFFEGLRAMFVTWGIANGFDEAVLIYALWVSTLTCALYP